MAILVWCKMPMRGASYPTEGHLTPNEINFSFCIQIILCITLSPENVYRYTLDVIRL